ncbi:hypothetical protein HC174_00515 [Salinimicrobium sp. CDJ15-81-2]|uniref:Uncharacterized protein n=1 Tax=Salinimicrobium oceani TaxID=2722702 RepID=A0ABX1D1J0_9FLAO|nr:hypothetical protein [Salinimicrobium oceani]NJW54364.1 hypothetical protein [Salinimicrobium oceani]NJY61238.1 hypothetical protein [Salinimicrobium nanhaiense]
MDIFRTAPAGSTLDNFYLTSKNEKKTYLEGQEKDCMNIEIKEIIKG